MKIYEGPGLIADRSDAVIIPVHLNGVQHSPAARLKGKFPMQLFPKITITVLPAQTIRISDDIQGQSRRKLLRQKLHGIMENMAFQAIQPDHTLFEALLKQVDVHADKIAIEDAERNILTYKGFLQKSFALGHHLKQYFSEKEAVGFLLPNTTASAVTFFALQAFGRVPAMLNFTAGEEALAAACQAAEVKTILTSKRFITEGQLDNLVTILGQDHKIIYLEDIKKKISIQDKLYGFLAPFIGHAFYKNLNVNSQEPAVILFTSGSEGLPKGVVLSHWNLISNIKQIRIRIDFNGQDVLFNCLPIFHAFGLTGGFLLPLLEGVKTIFYPSPLHYRTIPEMVYASNATIMFATDTFLNGYARNAEPYDFYRMRYIFAGAEKLKEETRKLYSDKFNVTVMQGYGITETAPVLAVNSAMHNKKGSVGRFMPGIEHNLEDVPGINEGGRLYVRGPNIMMGYFKAEQPGVLQSPENGWHDTGDIVDIDAEGYVTIMGRAKRFSKIAGEMISLTRVEQLAQSAYPDAQHAAVSVSDPKKGEQIILISTEQNISRDHLRNHATQQGISELAVPKVFMHLESLPVMGTGKLDYIALQEIAYTDQSLSKH